MVFELKCRWQAYFVRDRIRRQIRARFTIKWIKRGPCTKANQLITRICTLFRHDTALDSPLTKVGGGWRHWAAGRPGWLAEQPMGPTTSTQTRGCFSLVLEVSSERLCCRRRLCCSWLPSINMREGEIRHTPQVASSISLLVLAL